MAEVVRVTTFIVIAFVVYFCLLGGNSVDATTVDTSSIQSTTTSYHSGEVLSTASPTKMTTITNSQAEMTKTSIADVECPDGVKCSDLGASCINCALNKLKNSCVYGDNVDVECKPISSKINCTGVRNFSRTFNCRFCYQTDPKEHSCNKQSDCKVITSPRQRYQTNCTVKENILCLGNRTFPKVLLCNWTSGYRWSTSVLLSLTLGGFGVDRFYLGHWREGLGKLFSFGGLGVWTLVDLILIIIGYVGPEDGSLYIF
ncbi:PREDICTED: TM2 domain-containing protein 3-like [Acropora digitifera]|uniref:TM2 domain-containing protein 3-like n=1 Tax=Acropora digitifera TaxID=70779 RepID=UPI00077A7188|nr:PREDICTED: TM2 domain-containing protein 3-like [Acropora digitifera]